MRWEDERYVRIYTRNTADWIAMQWQGRAVFYELSRNVDRTGFVALGKSGMRGLAGMLLLPIDVAETGIQELLTDGCVIAVDGGLLIRNFIEAQETPQSDKARKRVQRERDRDTKRESATASRVTQADEIGPPVTSRDDSSHIVTESHAPSHEVTPGHSVPCRAVLNRADPPYPPQAGAGGSPDEFALSPPDVTGARRAKRQGPSSSELAYSDAYVAGQCDAEPSCGFSPLTASAVRLLGAATGAHAKDRFKQPLKGEGVLAWIRETSAEFRRSAEPAFAKGFSVFAFKAWLDAGRPVTRHEPLPEPPKPARELPEPPPPRANTRMTYEQQRELELAKIKAAMSADAEVSHG